MEADVDKPFSKAEELLKAETEIEEVHLQLTKFEMTDDTLQKEVFERLADMFPQVLEGDSEYVKFNVHGGEDLHVEMNGDVLTICQTYEQNGMIRGLTSRLITIIRRLSHYPLKTAVWEFMRNTVPN